MLSLCFLSWWELKSKCLEQNKYIFSQRMILYFTMFRPGCGPSYIHVRFTWLFYIVFYCKRGGVGRQKREDEREETRSSFRSLGISVRFTYL